MRIGGDGAYLVLHTDAKTGKRQIELLSDLPEAIKRWRAGTRVSPIWPAVDFQPCSDLSNAPLELMFVGPVEPSRAIGDSGLHQHASSCAVWVTAGMLNLMAGAPIGGVAIPQLKKWAERTETPYEHWRVEGGYIKRETCGLITSLAVSDLLDEISAQAKSVTNSSAQTALQEFYVLLSSTITRAAALSPNSLANIRNIAQTFCGIIKTYAIDKPSTPELLHNLVSMNAALSRFASQAFSGTPRITTSECHFWIHSLLGTGSANLALDRMAEWVFHTLGSENLPERVRVLKGKTDGTLPTYNKLQSEDPNPAWEVTQLVPVLAPDSPPPSAVVTYFSGRDGYHGDTQTLSAPLVTIAECNAHRSSLITITHEISHIIMEGILGHVFPNMYEEDELRYWREEVIYKKTRAHDYRNALSHILFHNVMAVESSKYADAPDYGQLSPNLLEIFAHRRNEAREILVHAFDFLYFYEADPQVYLEGIWQTWSSIPKIHHRMESYVMRSLCAVSAGQLSQDTRKQLHLAADQLRAVLEGLKAKPSSGNDYVDRALRHLNKSMAADKIDVFEKKYAALMGYARFVRTFLFSKRIQDAMFVDPFMSGGKYNDRKQWLVYDHHPVGNPVNFLRTRLRDDTNSTNSIWLLHNIAFSRPPP